MPGNGTPSTSVTVVSESPSMRAKATNTSRWRPNTLRTSATTTSDPVGTLNAAPARVSVSVSGAAVNDPARSSSKAPRKVNP